MKENRSVFPYEDILHLPRPVSTRKAKMSTLDRAAQFSPFSALTGYDDAITETARLTEGRVELTEGEKARINTRLQFIVENKAYDETVIIRYFEYDLLKAGGTYLSASGSIKKVDPYERSVIMDDGSCIPIEHIYSIDGDMFKDAENDFGRVGTYVLLIPGFIRLLALRNGIRSVQKKADLPPHGGNGMLVWYLIILILGLINFTGISVWGLLIAYIFILRNLYKLSKELDEAGYAISPAPVKLSDNAAKLIYVVAIALALVIGYGFFNKYPMNWTPVVYDQTNEVQGIRQELLDLGFPEVVMDDLTSEEIMACEGATYIMVLQRDYDVDQNRGIGTQEEIDGGKIALTTIDKATPQLRMTYVGVKFGDEREQWQIIHHFEWLDDRKFCGTEAVQLWPYSQEGWNVSSDFTGRVLYELDRETLTSDYHSIGKVTYEANALAAQMLGQYESTDVFATFSLPNQGERRRGYVMYELSEMIDGYIISSWFNYVHQYSQLQFPVQTAKDFEMTSFFNRGYAFKTIQTALQFTTHGEIPELF